MTGLSRFVRDVVVGAVWAGALTALALGHQWIGLLLAAVGVWALIFITRRGVPSFGASRKQTTTTNG